MALRGNPDQDAEGGEDDELLPCGASLADLWDTRRPAPGHQSCSSCGRALGELTALQKVVADTVAAAPPAGESLSERVMALVRTELRPGRTVPLGGVDDQEWITEAAATRVLRSAAEEVPGVAAGSCRIHPAASAGAPLLPGSRLPRGPLMVRIELAVTPDRPLPQIAAEVHVRLSESNWQRLGLHLASIHVTVVDLVTDAPGNNDGKANP